MGCHCVCHEDGVVQAADVSAPCASKVKCRAVIDRGANQGQAKGDVDRFTKTGIFEHGQTLVVVHGEYRIGVLQTLAGK